MNRVERLIQSPVGALIARPWFDLFVLGFFTHRFFPLSRLWAAARAALGGAARRVRAVVHEERGGVGPGWGKQDERARPQAGDLDLVRAPEEG